MRSLLLIVICFCCQNLFSQALSFSLGGYVSELESKKRIEGATIKLVSSDNAIIEIKTDSTGHYFFGSSAVRPNTSYVVSASAMDVRTPEFTSGLMGNPKAKFTTVGDSVSRAFRQDLVLKKAIICFGAFPMITFDKNSDSITPFQRANLDLLVRIMVENPNITVEVDAHSSPDEKDPQMLSYMRAKKVVNFLIIEKQIDPNRISPAGYGSSKPLIIYGDSTAPSGKIIPNGTVLTKEWIKKNCPKPVDQEYANHLNRRVVFSVLRRDYFPEKKVSTSGTEPGK
jgi:peptidoglycan-associated lipoprotein